MYTILVNSKLFLVADCCGRRWKTSAPVSASLR